MTKQRSVLLSVFRSDDCIGKHKTADELWELAKKQMPTISRATVYNNLRSMEQEGIIRRITADGGADVYDSSFTLHAHLICTECHKIKDISCPELLSELCRISGQSIDSYELKLRYLCETCRGGK